MKEIDKDILQNPSLKENPFTVPPGYFSGIEDQVHAKIRGALAEEMSPEENFSAEVSLPEAVPVKTGRLAVLKTHFALAATFVFILGIGYGFLHLTDSLGRKSDNLSANENAWLQDSILHENLLKEVLKSAPLDESEMLEAIQIKDPGINTEDIEQYLIDSNVPLVSLASLE